MIYILLNAKNLNLTYLCSNNAQSTTASKKMFCYNIYLTFLPNNLYIHFPFVCCVIINMSVFFSS